MAASTSPSSSTSPLSSSAPSSSPQPSTSTSASSSSYSSSGSSSASPSVESGLPPCFHSNCSASYPALSSSRYRLQSTLQQSLFGCVKLAHDHVTGQLLCVKISLLSSASMGLTVQGGKVVSEDVQREAELLRALRGVEGVVELLDELQDDHFHYLVLQHAGDDLYVWLKSLPVPPQPHLASLPHRLTAAVPALPEERARPLFRQLAAAVQACHARHIALGDLSLENVCMQEDGSVRVIDLGLARRHPQADVEPPGPAAATMTHSKLGVFPVAASSPSSPLSGKLAYLSPESFAHLPYDAYAHDRFALGVLLYTLLVGRPPYFEPSAHTDYWSHTIPHPTHSPHTQHTQRTAPASGLRKPRPPDVALRARVALRRAVVCALQVPPDDHE